MGDETNPAGQQGAEGQTSGDVLVSEQELDKLFDTVADGQTPGADPLTPPESGDGQDGAPEGEAAASGEQPAAQGTPETPNGQPGSGEAPASSAPNAGDGKAAAPAAAAPEGAAKPAPKAAAAKSAPAQNQGTESLEEKVRRLEHSKASTDGRIAALLRENEELKRNKTSTPSTSPAPAAAAADKQGKDGRPAQPKVLADLTSDENWKKMATDYPEIAGPIEKALGALAQRQELTDADRQRAVMTANAAIVDKVHPDAGRIVRTPEFKAWADTQPSYVRDVLVKNATGINSPDDCIDIFTRFKASPSFTQAKPAPANGGQEPPVNNAERAAQAARDLRRDSALAVKNGSGVQTHAEPDDPDKLFDYVVARMEKKSPQRAA